MSLVIAVPVLNRPARVAAVIASVTQATPERHRLLFIANEDDEAEVTALRSCRADVLVVPPERRSWACKINDALNATDEEWLFTGADDLKFHPGWFTRALAWAEEATRVIGTNDICNPRVMTGEHSTHTLFRRDYVEQFGTIDEPGKVIHEGYGHAHADDEAVGTAKARGVYVHAFDSIVEHLHPNIGKAEMDATYRLGVSHDQKGRRLFAQRKALWLRPTKPQPKARIQSVKVPAPDRAVVVTATYGGYDPHLRPPAPQDMNVDYVCVTDDAELRVPSPWRVVLREPRFPGNPRLSAKVPKMCPDVGCEDVVWIDASHEITSPTFVREALAARHDGIAAFKHPRRTDPFQEIEALLGSENQNGLYFDRPLREQADSYRNEGHPQGGGLYACGTLAWDLRNPKARQLGEAWLEETAKWSHQDQVEFPVVLRRLGITPGVFPVAQIEPRFSRGPYLGNRWLRIWPHSKAASPASVLIPFTSSDHYRQDALEFVRGRYEALGWQVIIGCCGGEWSKGRALADARAEAEHEALVIADADCFVDDGAISSAVDALTGSAWAVAHHEVARLSRVGTHRVLSGATPTRQHIERRHTAPLGGGIVVVRREAWDEVGGIDPRFIGWGGDDEAFGRALETLCGPPHRARGTLWHLWHPPAPNRKNALPASEALAGRYLTAKGDPEAMRAIVAEARVGALG